MTDTFECKSHSRLAYHHGYRHAYLGDVPQPVVYRVQGALRAWYGGGEGPPVASTLDHIVGVGCTLRIQSIAVHYDLTAPALSTTVRAASPGRWPSLLMSRINLQNAA